MTKLYEDVYISELRGALQRVTNEFAIGEAAKIVVVVVVVVVVVFVGGWWQMKKPVEGEDVTDCNWLLRSVKIQVFGLSQFVATHLS